MDLFPLLAILGALCTSSYVVRTVVELRGAGEPSRSLSIARDARLIYRTVLLWRYASARPQGRKASRSALKRRSLRGDAPARRGAR